MIIRRGDAHSKAAAEMLVKPNEIIQVSGKLVKLPGEINDNTLTIIDLSGDGIFQDAYDCKDIAEWIKDVDMIDRVRHIELIVSDVNQPDKHLEVLCQNLHDYLDSTGHKNIEIHASFVKGCRGSFLVPNPKTNNWHLYGIPASVTYQYPNGYKPTADNLLRDFGDQLKLEKITNMREWIRERCRAAVETPYNRPDENTRP